jgi:hypothetical protein
VRHAIVFLLCGFSVAQTGSSIPSEVLHKTGYINPVPKPTDFSSAMLWGIAIADTRVPGYRKSKVEISQAQLTCRVDGRDFALNDDRGQLRGGLYRRHPWFGTDEHDPMPKTYSGTPWRSSARSVVLRVGSRPDHVWHFWAASPRRVIPAGHFEGCMVKVRAKISQGAMLQVGFDYWRNPGIGYESGGNNHEAGASDWYFPLDAWQEAVFSDIHIAK